MHTFFVNIVGSGMPDNRNQQGSGLNKYDPLGKSIVYELKMPKSKS